MGRSWPLHNAQPFGGKLKDMILISDRNGSLMSPPLHLRQTTPYVEFHQKFKSFFWCELRIFSEKPGMQMRGLRRAEQHVYRGACMDAVELRDIDPMRDRSRGVGHGAD